MTETLEKTAQFTRAQSAAVHVPRQRTRTHRTVQQDNLEAVAQHMFSLMLRNVASDGFQFTDPANPGRFSKPGCVIAAPSYPAATPGVDQDYVFNWTRDAAITAMEIAAAGMPTRPGTGVQALIDYVSFAQACQANATPTLAHACYTIDGQSRPWTEQADGPALQTVALLQAFGQLDQAAQEVARQLIARNVDFVLGAYQQPTFNLWEEHSGYSFFARAAQLRCLREISANTVGIGVPPAAAGAIAGLEYGPAGTLERRRLPQRAGPVRRRPGLRGRRLRPQHRHRDGLRVRGHPLHGHAAARHGGDNCASSGPTAPHPSSTPSTGPTRRSALARCWAAIPATPTTATSATRFPAAIPGRCARPTSPNCTTGWPARSPGRNRSRTTTCPATFFAPGRDRRGHAARRGGRRPGGRGRRHAPVRRLPQRRPGTERAVRRHLRLREERARPHLELRGVPVGGAGEDRSPCRGLTPWSTGTAASRRSSRCPRC